MSDQPETLAAILAEMRDERIIRIGGADVTRCLLLNLADRIEAAADRERVSLQDTIDKMRRAIAENTPGNAAAMREALNRVEHLANGLRNITERDTEVRADVNEIVDVCRAALAAPARNCDRFSTAEEAYAAWMKDNSLTAICDWLFAPAEGGAV